MQTQVYSKRSLGPSLRLHGYWEIVKNENGKVFGACRNQGKDGQ